MAATYSADFEKALAVGRPPTVAALFPNSKALIVSGKVVDRAMVAKGNAIAMAANGRNYFVIRGALLAAQRANCPMIIEIAVASSPTVSEIRDPHTVRANTDRPKLSVPKGKSQLGPSNAGPLQGQVTFSASRSAISGAPTATRMKKIRMISPAMPIPFLRYTRQILASERRRRAHTIARELRGAPGGGVGWRSAPGGGPSAA